MVRTELLHPDLLQALAANGHGARILIADGNYPITTHTAERAKKIWLNLAPDQLNVTTVLKILNQYTPIESYAVMVPADGSPQPIHETFSEILGRDIPQTTLDRMDFYEAARSPDCCLAIATGETRRFANILLTIGVHISPTP